MGADFLTGLWLIRRSNYAMVFLFFAIVLVAMVLVGAEFSARQPATVALDVGISVIRLALPIVSILLVQELVAREFERRTYLLSLTFPRARSFWLLGRILAVFVVTLLMLALLGGELALLVQYAAGSYKQATLVSLGTQYWVTLGLIAFDLLVVVAIATLLAVVTTTPGFVLIGSIGFLLIARSFAPVVQLLQEAGYLVEKFADPRLYRESLGMVGYFLPDLGTLDVRMIALYGKWDFLPNNVEYLIMSVMMYAAAIISLAVWRLNTREFS